MFRIIQSIFWAVALLATLSCASIIHGTRQDVGVSSTPTGASIFVDGELMGKTPAAVTLKRKHNHTIRLELDGYEPFEMTLTHKASGWVWGNLVFGMLPGLIIDAVSGGLYKLTPDQVTARMKKSNTKSGVFAEDLMRITLVRTAPQGVNPIGHLQRSGR